MINIFSIFPIFRVDFCSWCCVASPQSKSQTSELSLNARAEWFLVDDGWADAVPKKVTLRDVKVCLRCSDPMVTVLNKLEAKWPGHLWMRYSLRLASRALDSVRSEKCINNAKGQTSQATPASVNMMLNHLRHCARLEEDIALQRCSLYLSKVG